MFHSTCYVRNGNLLKSCVSEIHVKQIRINQGIGVVGNKGSSLKKLAKTFEKSVTSFMNVPYPFFHSRHLRTLNKLVTQKPF